MASSGIAFVPCCEFHLLNVSPKGEVPIKIKMFAGQMFLQLQLFVLIFVKNSYLVQKLKTDTHTHACTHVCTHIRVPHATHTPHRQTHMCTHSTA
jgi:hypothetical protein